MRGMNRITLLADNIADAPFLSEHGFAALIEQSHFAPLLFDVGRGAIWENSALLQKELSSVEALILSHAHYDHTDALPRFFQLNPEALLYASKNLRTSHYSNSTGECRPIGLSPESCTALKGLKERNRNQLRLFSSFLEMAERGVLLYESIEQSHSLEAPSPNLFTDSDCSAPDSMIDEVALSIEARGGLFLLTGCCHCGIINLCEAVKRRREKPIIGVMGGLHLAGSSSERLEATASYLKNEGVERVILCHCTGDEESAFLKTRLGDRVTIGRVGLELEI